MRGFPPHLNTKEDYLNMLNIDPAKTVTMLQELLDTRCLWIQTKELESEEEGVTDDTHEVRELVFVNPDTQQQEKKYCQYEWQESPYTPLFQLGFTVQEVDDLIQQHR